MNTGARKQALALARAAAKDSTDAKDFQWLARLCRVASKTEAGDERKKLEHEAEEAYLWRANLKGPIRRRTGWS